MSARPRLQPRRPGASLLIVEDDPDGRAALERLLRFAGYVVTSCANGGEALAQLRGGMKLPDLILLDLMMPVMDGTAFRAEQKRDLVLAAIPVVAVSAQGDLRATVDADAYLHKPLEFDSLVATIDRMLPERPGGVAQASVDD